MSDIKTFPSKSELMQATAEQFVKVAESSVASRGRFTIALSGGSTPRGLYSRLTEETLAHGVDWSRVVVFWGDERAVPPDNEESNFRMVDETLLSKVLLAPQNIHRILAELPPQEAAARYEQTLRDVFFAESAPTEDHVKVPEFDLILLGMGTDGHTASLFPGVEAIHESTRWVVAHYVPKLGVWRISLTPVVLNAARQVIFLVSGNNKAEVLKKVLDGPYQPDTLPSQIVQPRSGNLCWMIDAAAASLL
jgi:6-phosphogluconolactonase